MALQWKMAAVAGVLAIALGCSKDSPTGVSVPVTGEWIGTTSQSNASIGFDVTLTEGTDNQIGGTGLATGYGGMGGTINFGVSGSRTGSSVTITFNTTGYTPPQFTARLSDASTLSGELNNSGFSHTALTLRR